MPRGVRKTPLERLKLELTDLQTSIQQYESCLVTLKQKEKDIQQQIDLEEFKAVQILLEEHGISMDDLKELLDSNVSAVENEQSV